MSELARFESRDGLGFFGSELLTIYFCWALSILPRTCHRTVHTLPPIFLLPIIIIGNASILRQHEHGNVNEIFNSPLRDQKMQKPCSEHNQNLSVFRLASRCSNICSTTTGQLLAYFATNNFYMLRLNCYI